MEYSTSSAAVGQGEPVLDEPERDASRQILGQLDDQDFQILKALEGKGSLDAFEVAGAARLSPGGVIEALTKLDGLGLVSVAAGEFPSQDERRFVINDERLEVLSK